MTDGGRVDVAGLERELGQELLRLHRESYGAGAEEARVHILDDMVVCLLDELELQRNEQFLIDAGQGDSVVHVRGRYQQAIETTFRAAVERATGRRVISFASVTKLNPNYSVELFRLGQREESSLTEPADR